MDTLTSLSAKLGHALQKRRYTLALAESCTGGMVASAVTEIAGSSAWFDCGFVTYSNEAKQRLLGVSTTTLRQFGAVSEETALEMALGALKNSQAQIAGSITGVAGPGGGSASKPVGTVCFAWAYKSGESVTATHHFRYNRQGNRQQASLALINGLLKLIESDRS